MQGRTITTAIKPSSIVIIQGAYQIFCVPAQDPIECDSQQTTGSVFALDEVMLVETQENWLKFRALAADWRDERGATSSITEAALCPAYQSIIGMGPLAIPFILAQLKSEGDEPDQWFWALKAITRTDPVLEEDRGDFIKMAQAWHDWADREGYAW